MIAYKYREGLIYFINDETQEVVSTLDLTKTTTEEQEAAITAFTEAFPPPPVEAQASQKDVLSATFIGLKEAGILDQTKVDQAYKKALESIKAADVLDEKALAAVAAVLKGV